MPVILRSASVGLQLPLLGRFPGTAMALLSVKFYCFILIDLSQFHPFQSLKNASPEFSRSETLQASREIPLPAPIRNLPDQLQWKRLLIRQPYRPLAGFIAGQLVLKPRNCLRAGIQADVPLGGGKLNYVFPAPKRGHAPGNPFLRIRKRTANRLPYRLQKGPCRFVLKCDILVNVLRFDAVMPLILILVGIIYILESLSDIIQVVYFNGTHGKRFFKMAPLHHHLELSGWSEAKLVTVFSGVTILFCVLAWLGIQGRY